VRLSLFSIYKYKAPNCILKYCNIKREFCKDFNAVIFNKVDKSIFMC
jgi:hypothetical protein